MGGDREGGWSCARCFVTPSTGGRVAAYPTEFQEVLWKELGKWVMWRTRRCKKQENGEQENQR